MKRLTLLTALAFAATLGAAAQSRDYLTFRKADGTEQSLPAVGLKLTFADGQVKAVNGQQSATFALADLRTMFFAQTATGITAAGQTATAAPVIVGGRLVTNAPAGSRVSVFTADGRRADADNLPRGLYIVRIDGQTHKVMSR